MSSFLFAASRLTILSATSHLGRVALAVGHMLGTVFTNTSLGKVAVSFHAHHQMVR
jgi:nitrate reductase gamma subunit